MDPLLTYCPVCDRAHRARESLVITRLECRQCGTTIEGAFTSSQFANLSPAQLNFLELFIRSEGKLSRMESELNLSYPTIRNRLHEIIRALGYEVGGEEPAPGLTVEERQRILEDLNQGHITAEEAMRMLGNP